MRCPDCSKFVSMENADPEEETPLDIDADGNITATFTLDRNCAECGTTLKQGQFELEDTIDEDVLKEHVNAEGATAPHELSIELDTADADESGGGRYAKNIFHIQVSYVVTCACDKEFRHDGTAETGTLAAGDFEECV